MLTIEGAYGEGGGQILRSAVSLSAITGKSIEVINIRAKRHNPGLRPQHMQATRAVAQIFHARVENLKVGAEWIRFIPKPDNYEEGELKIDTGTAGSIPMILQTIIPAVALSGKSLSVQITGGTDVKMSPTADYLRFIVLKAYKSIGINFSLNILKRGYYPKGGGIIQAEIRPCKNTRSFDLLNRRNVEPKIANVCCQLPKNVAERQISSALLRLERRGVRCNVYSSSFESSLSPGTSILVYSESDFGTYIGGDSVGAREKSAEKVGEEAVQNFFESYQTNVPIDRFLADMLVIPLSLAKGKSRYRIGIVTEHLKTNLHVVSQIVGCKYQIEPSEKSYIVTIEGRLPE
ncbi:MAG: RNA 3'-terminal phosphate cyclase [Candidatus Nitrosopolaris sp.]